MGVDSVTMAGLVDVVNCELLCATGADIVAVLSVVSFCTAFASTGVATVPLLLAEARIVPSAFSSLMRLLGGSVDVLIGTVLLTLGNGATVLLIDNGCG